jgi:hypothetical protein
VCVCLQRRWRQGDDPQEEELQKLGLQKNASGLLSPLGHECFGIYSYKTSGLRGTSTGVVPDPFGGGRHDADVAHPRLVGLVVVVGGGGGLALPPPPPPAAFWAPAAIPIPILIRISIPRGDAAGPLVVVEDLVRVLQDRVDDLDLPAGVGDGGRRVRAHQRRPEDDGQVVRVHAVRVRVVHDAVQVQR